MIKRVFDILLALAACILLGPVILLVTMMVRSQLGAPAIFRQVRPGRNGRPFKMFKFRSMTDDRDAKGDLLPDEERMHPFGKWLRKSSLDELPELWNVLRGDMSLVGPRPLLMEYLPRYNARQARRHDVRPGITGWAQVNGRNALSWEEKFEQDIWYVEHRSMVLDLKILFMTLAQVVRPSGVNAEGHVTMPKFHGTGDGNE